MSKIKKLFSTPKKAFLAVICIIAILVLLGTGAVFAAGVIAESSAIGTENAKNFAFADANVDPVSASNVKAEFDYEHGQFVYEVEFTAGDTEYEYWIRARDGAVVKKQVEIITRNGSNVTATAEITMDKAKEIALVDANLSIAEVTFMQEKLDVDDGISIYDIEFFADNVKYEYEINAVTGAVYSKSKEAFAMTSSSPDQSAVPKTTMPPTTIEPQTTSWPIQVPDADTSVTQQTQKPVSQNISADTAKNKALADAGVSASSAVFTKVKLDYDDGILLYDVEFYTTDCEYEYEIDAKTGMICDKDTEILKTTPKQQENHTNSSYIGVEKAKSIALNHAGVSNVTFTKTKLDDDDGQVVYEIEFRKEGVEYDYTIHATDGSILAYDTEWDD